MAVRPSREEHHHLSLVTCQVALPQVTPHLATAARAAARPDTFHASTGSRFRLAATEPDRRRTLPRRPGQWLWQRE